MKEWRVDERKREVKRLMGLERDAEKRQRERKGRDGTRMKAWSGR